MKFALDHVVIAFNDLQHAIDDYRARGFTVVPGGRHPGRTSHNALVVFGDGSYLELIAWLGANPAERWNNVLRAHGEGFMDFALIPEDVPRAISEARARGLRIDGPVDGGRVRPDGRELKWQTGRQTTFDLPFLCGDVTPREWRVPEGECRTHANGARGVSRITVAVGDARMSAARYATLLGIPASASIDLGGTRIELVEGRVPPRGEGVIAVALRSDQGEIAL